MAHNLKSAEIRQMYELLYKYERKLSKVNQKESVSIADLDFFGKTHDIFVDTINKANETKAVTHNGYILFSNANKLDKDYYLIKRIRDAFAHGFVEVDKQTGMVCIKDGKRKIKSEIPRQLVIPLFKHLVKVTTK